jgi:signal transduction histidine kinase
MSRNHETALFRVFQGALSNIAEHSKAKRVQITARMSKGSVVQMSIEDDGIGFSTADRPARQMFGLTAMKERIEKLGGHFRLKSRPVSSKGRSGTKIDVDLPMSTPNGGAARR